MEQLWWSLKKKKQQLLDGNRNWTVFFPVRAHVCPPEVALEEFQWLHGCTAWTWRIIMWIMPPCMNMIPWRGRLWPKRHIVHVVAWCTHTTTSWCPYKRPAGDWDGGTILHFPTFYWLTSPGFPPYVDSETSLELVAITVFGGFLSRGRKHMLF